MADKVTVTMTDGREVEFGVKQKLIKTHTISEAGDVVVRMDFSNGETRDFTVRPDMIARFAAHGAEQKLGDVIAGEKDINDAVLAVEDLIARLNNGEWTATRASGGMAGTSVLLQALVEVSGKSVEELKTFLSTKSQAEKLALRRSDLLAPVVTRLEAEKAKNSKNAIDGAALLSELGDFGAPSKKKAEASA